jgi:hypothetical protein
MEARVFRETATWDLRYINREPSMSMKLYILFLLFCCIVTSVEIFKASPLSAEAFLHLGTSAAVDQVL